MSEFNASDRDVTRAIRSWLNEDRHEDASRIAAAVLDRVEATPRRRVSWWPARRTQTVTKILGFAAGATAVVVAVVLGVRLLGPASTVGPGSAPTPTPSPSAEPSVAAPSSSAGYLPDGSHVLAADSPNGVPITVAISAPGWYGQPAEGTLAKNDTADPPVGAGLIAFAEDGPWYVPGDPCHYATTLPDAPATSVDELVTALGGQASRDASTPVAITVGGHAGKSITLHVPKDAVFGTCDNDKFCSWANALLSPADPCFRHAQGPGEIDEVSVVDVNGKLVILDIGWYEATPQTVIDELHAIVASATFD